MVRVEFAGAYYDVMARADCREMIVRDEADREIFMRTLSETSERNGFRALPFSFGDSASQSFAGGWDGCRTRLRVASTRGTGFGHLFGGRCKAILVEPGNSFWALPDYIHLNPVRAGIVGEKDGVESYAWSSLPHYVGPRRKRPPWMGTATGFEVCGCPETAAGRREFLGLLERRVDWRSPRLAGTSFPEGNDKPQLAVYSSLRRGWFFGSEEFREKLLNLLARWLRRIKKATGYYGPQLNDQAEKRARELIRAALEHFGTDLAMLQRARKGDWRKGLLAAVIQKETTMRLDWITEQLNMGTRAGTCRLAAEFQKRLATDRTLREVESISKRAIVNG